MSLYLNSPSTISFNYILQLFFLSTLEYATTASIINYTQEMYTELVICGKHTVGIVFLVLTFYLLTNFTNFAYYLLHLLWNNG